MEKKSVSEQLQMIMCGTHDEIMAYIAKWCLCDEGEVALIKRGNHNEIMAYIADSALGDEAEIALVERGNDEEITLYLHSWKFSDEAREALHERGDVDMKKKSADESLQMIIKEIALMATRE